MSRSPKYTTALITGPAAHYLAKLAAERDGIRRRATERALREKVRQDAIRLRLRIEDDGLFLMTLRAKAARAGLGADADRLAAALFAAGQRIAAISEDFARRNAPPSTAASAAELKTVWDEVRRAEHGIRRLADVAAEATAVAFTSSEHRAKLDALRSALHTVAAREWLDRTGAANVALQLDIAERAVGMRNLFDKALAAARAAAEVHLETAAMREAELDAVRHLADDAAAALRSVLDEAAEVDVRLARAEEAGAASIRLLSDLAAAPAGWPDFDAGVGTARHRTEALRAAAAVLADDLEAQLAQRDRIRHVLQAHINVLPGHGYDVMRGSLVQEDGRVRFRAVRMDDPSAMEIVLTPGDDSAVDISYHVDGSDFVTVQTIDGEERACVVTQASLEAVQADLSAKHDVTTDGLRWLGKPRQTPDDESVPYPGTGVRYPLWKDRQL